MERQKKYNTLVHFNSIMEEPLEPETTRSFQCMKWYSIVLSACFLLTFMGIGAGLFVKVFESDK